MPLIGIVTTDLAAITRGRFMAVNKFARPQVPGVEWYPSYARLTAFGTLAAPSVDDVHGDLRLLPDIDARFRTSRTLAASTFDIAIGDLCNLDGSPWACCPRGILRQALKDLERLHGMNLLASFQHEFVLQGNRSAAAHAYSVEAFRRVDPLGAQIFSALEEAGVRPEMLIAKSGTEQFEVSCAPTDAMTAADRSIAIREIVRETAHNSGFRASFTPKACTLEAGSGVHIHLSLWDTTGRPRTYDADQPGELSREAGAFFAGVLRHLPAITAYTAPSEASHMRLRSHNRTYAYTWLAEQARNAALRVCPVFPKLDAAAAGQHNVEFQLCDATANPYIAMAALVRAGMQGLGEGLSPAPVVDVEPSTLSRAERELLQLRPLPGSVEEALTALEDDRVASSWFGADFMRNFLAVRRAELADLARSTPDQVCQRYLAAY